MHLQIIDPEIIQIYRCYVRRWLLCLLGDNTTQEPSVLSTLTVLHSMFTLSLSPQVHLCLMKVVHSCCCIEYRFTCVSYVQDMQWPAHKGDTHSQGKGVCAASQNCSMCYHEWAARFGLGPCYNSYSPADLESNLTSYVHLLHALVSIDE